MINQKLVEVQYLETNKMIADVLTKPLGRVKHLEFAKGLGVG
jgi:hypothetical protein